MLDISPTRTMYAHTDQAFATAYYHWFFLIQPFDLPERLIGADPCTTCAASSAAGARGLVAFRSARARRIRALLQRSGDDPRDVRGLPRRGVDRSRARCRGRRRAESTCPLLVLWGAQGVVHRLFDPVDDWRAVADDVRGQGAAVAGITSPRRRPTRRCASCWRSSSRDADRGASRRESKRSGELRVCYNRALGQVAQLVEQRTENPCVGGSIPPLATIFRAREADAKSAKVSIRFGQADAKRTQNRPRFQRFGQADAKRTQNRPILRSASRPAQILVAQRAELKPWPILRLRFASR